jgi:hypothetical protein
VTAPERTAIEKDELPHPLIIIFNASVAPLEQVGKEISQGLTMKPAVSGHWLWTDDKTLVFRPENDWPVGSVHEVDFEDSLVAEQIVLARTRFEFSTAPFTAALEKGEFFQDQIDPGLKKAIFQLHFSHPVDADSLEKRSL